MQRGAGVDGFAGQHHLAGARLADAADQALGASGPRHQAEGDLRQAEAGAFAADNEVAGQRQLAAGAQGIAVHRRQQRLAELRQPLPQLRTAIRQRGRQILPLQLVQIGPGGEETRRAGDHHGAHAAVGIGLLQQKHQLLQARGAQGVARLRAVQRQRDHAVLLLAQNKGGIHRGS
ncbi:Uncharacterised protein [Acinetobacter baumannii]|nr:Uncharacterised protein [Acinetobacter baumannii]